MRSSIKYVASAVMVIAVSAVVYAAEHHFHDQSGKKGCASIITERGQDECARVQRAKDDACSVSVSCEPDKQERTISKYKEAKERLERGDVADADKDRLKDTVRALKDELDARKDAARRGTSAAEGCVRAREAVQKWFADTGIPLTERTRDDALRQRKDLTDKRTEAQKKLVEARNKRDANPRDSSAQNDYDRAAEEMRNAEKALEAFNAKYGRDIEQHAQRLIDHYKEEKDSHDRPLTEAKNRVENCKKVDGLSY